MLFSNNDLQAISDTSAKPASGLLLDLSNSFISGDKQTQIAGAIGHLLPGNNVFFKTNGAWSNIELVEHLLQLTGPAKIYFSTWSISAEAITRMSAWLASGAVTDLFALLDAGIRNRKPEIYQQASAAFNIMKLTHIHAKVTVLASDTHKIILMGSANYTKNPRIETGMIIWNDELAAENIKWILEEIYATN